MDPLPIRALRAIRHSLDSLQAGRLAERPENLAEMAHLAEVCGVPDRRLLQGWLRAADIQAAARAARRESASSRARSQRLRTRVHLHVVPRGGPPAGP